MLQAEQIDRRLASLRDHVDLASRPKAGWIRAIREALLMTTVQLANRVGVKQPRITEIEHAELHGRVTLQSMERAAEALGCRFVYFFMPVEPLVTMIDAQAERVAAKQMAHISQNMKLEDQHDIHGAVLTRLKLDLKSSIIKQHRKIWAEETDERR